VSVPRLLKRWAVVGLTAALAVGLTTTISTTAAADPAPQPVPMTERGPRVTQTGSALAEHSDGTRTAPLAATSDLDTTAACEVADFTGRTGSDLVEFIAGSETSCINTLFSLTGSDAHGAFREDQMVSVSYGMRDRSVNYTGDNGTGLASLVLYLRAGYFVQWYHPQDVGEYGPALRAAIQSGLDTFFAHPRSREVTDANGEILTEAVVLIDSAQENARYLPVVDRILSDYDSGYHDSWWMLNAVNSVYTVLFRGHQVPEFVAAVVADRSILQRLERFALDNLGSLGGDTDFLVSNAGRELGRFLQHDQLRDQLRPQLLNLLNASSITGDTAPLWVGVAEMTDYFDQAQCSYYDTCGLSERLMSKVLPISHSCDSSVQVRAQDVTLAQLEQACDSLLGQNAYFHDVARDNGPVADDYNSRIQVVVFDSSSDYQTYAGAIFGIDTNNGGMYLEGDPANPDNLPRFIAYEAEWMLPDFAIWNLNHEYTHYLDGRYNMYGDFAENMTTPTIWWVEGFAEYIAYSYQGIEYTEAIEEAGRATYGLDTLFDTSYDHDTNRVYRWGYLAVRFMIEHQRSDVDVIVGHYRTGQWQAARDHLAAIGSSYNDQWHDWLSKL